MSRFRVAATRLPGLQVVERIPMRDARGSLTRMFCSEDLAAAGWQGPVVQVNLTQTRARGAVRGMHYQLPPHAEQKLVSCLRGEVFDVAVDLRAGSPTCLQWHGERLSADNHRALLIPRGFAHGFQALTDDVELLYCHSAAFNASAEAGLSATDAALAIAWPLPVGERSPRDLSHPPITAQFQGIHV